MELNYKFLFCCVMLLLLLTCALANIAEEKAENAYNVPTCKQADININECLKAALQIMMPRTRNGIAELNIPSIDPYDLNKMAYQYDNGAIKGRINMKNVKIYGISDSIVENVDFKLNNDKMLLEINSTVPHMIIEGHYKADVRFNNLKLLPKGYFNLTLTNVVNNAKSEGELYEKNGHTYLRLTKYLNTPEVDDMHVFADGIFPDPALNELMLEFVNQYWRQIYKEVLPETRNTWEPFLLKVINDFLSTVPFDSLIIKNKK